MIEMLSFYSNLYIALSCLTQVMGNLSKINKVNHSNSKGGKGALRQQQQTAGPDKTSMVCPPQHVLDLASFIRDSTDRTKTRNNINDTATERQI